MATTSSTIDALVNNAGLHRAKGLLETELEDWNTVLAINATGRWLGVKHVVPVMRSAGGGSVVDASSVAGTVGGPAADAGGAAGAASKGAVPLPPHVGEGLDIACAMAHLASDGSKCMTGAELVVDSGFLSH